jgi:hypothetical protein
MRPLHNQSVDNPAHCGQPARCRSSAPKPVGATR